MASVNHSLAPTSTRIVFGPKIGFGEAWNFFGEELDLKEDEEDCWEPLLFWEVELELLIFFGPIQ